MKNSTYDVLIIGGSHAGLSAAMALGRLNRTALVVDSGNPRNLASEHANNIAGLDGINPSQFRVNARSDLAKYATINFAQDEVLTLDEHAVGFIASLTSGLKLTSRKVIVATGLNDKLPDIEGINALWGSSVFHCPYCHGYEFIGENIGILGSGPVVEHVLPTMRNVTDKLTLFTQGQAGLSKEFSDKLIDHKIQVFDSEVSSLTTVGNKLSSLELTSGEQIELQALLILPTLPFELQSNIVTQLGCEMTDLGLVKVSEMGKTSVPGVFAAGDITSMQQSVLGAAATGQMAGSGAVFELSQEDFLLLERSNDSK